MMAVFFRPRLAISDAVAKACVFEVGERPVLLMASGSVPFWSFAVYDSSSNEVFSMNDRSAAGGDLATAR